MKIRRGCFGERHRSVAVSYNRVGFAHSRLQEYDQALANCRKALALFEQLYDSGHPEVAASHNNIG